MTRLCTVLLNAVSGPCQSLVPFPQWYSIHLILLYPPVPLRARHLTFSPSLYFLMFYFSYSCRRMHITFTFKISPLLKAEKLHYLIVNQALSNFRQLLGKGSTPEHHFPHLIIVGTWRFYFSSGCSLVLLLLHLLGGKIRMSFFSLSFLLANFQYSSSKY